MRERKFKTLIAGKIFAVLLGIFQLFYFLAFSELADFEAGIQFLSLFSYDDFIPPGFGPFIVWVLPHILVFSVILTFYWWDFGDIPKWIALGANVGLTIINQIWFATFFPFIMWIFFIYLFIRLPPKAVRKLFRLISKKKNNNVRDLVKKIPTWSQLLGILLILPLFIPTIPAMTGELEKEPREWNLTYPDLSFYQRKDKIFISSIISDNRGYNTQIVKAYRGWSIYETVTMERLYKINGSDGGDFELQKVLRLLYINNKTNVLSLETYQNLTEAVLNGRFWVDQLEGGVPSTGIYTTENHQIGYHTAELLAGQMFRNETFTRTLMTGEEHIAHAEDRIFKWLDWRARFGFSEYHSNSYLNVDFKALLNLVDFAENATIQTQATMLLDLMLFDFANNYFKDLYAVAQGRIYGRTRVAEVRGGMQRRDSISGAVWLWLGIGGFDGGGMGSSEAFAITSSYTPPPILEKIANDAKNYNEHKDRNGLNTDEGAIYGVQYNEEDLMYWWGMTNFLNPEIIELSYEFIERNNIDPALIFGPGVIELTRFLSNMKGVSLEEYSLLLDEITKGMAQSAANSYVYRTPHYQLSGLQANAGAGGSGIQEQIWQASLSNDAYVFTNAPSGISWKGGPFMGGWKPYSVFEKSLGIVMYDHEHEIFAGRLIDGAASSLLNAFTGNRPRNHAYFPKWAFDDVVRKGKWTFGSKDGGYLALYSKNPTFWANDYELVALGKRNVWIIEMGSEDEYSSFEDFINQVRESEVKIDRKNLGFSVVFDSPSQGNASVEWGGDFIVNGTTMDLDYERFENKYVVTADFNSTETIIEFNGERLTLNFENNTRLYEP